MTNFPSKLTSVWASSSFELGRTALIYERYRTSEINPVVIWCPTISYYIAATPSNLQTQNIWI